jgi:GWxTD domain-containing protein
VPSSQPFIETYLTIVGNSLASKNVNGKLQNSVNISVFILKDSSIVKANKYNLNGPLYEDSLRVPNFLDNQRYPLDNGSYAIQVSISDNYNRKQKPQEFKQKFVISFGSKQVQASSIQALESYKKATTVTNISKSGYDLIPYTVNYFPETQNELPFYLEVYNTDTVLGRNKPFVFSYYLEHSNTLKKLDAYGAFKKQVTAPVNPLLGRIDISKLGTGNYNLVVEVRDEKNMMQYQGKYFFQRLNKAVDLSMINDLKEKKTIDDYFGACNNSDTLKMFVECLWPIANGTDKERIINQAVKKNPVLMKQFIIDFWQRRAADTANPLIMWARYYKNVQQVMVLFRCGKQPGYYTERGRVYLQYGPPNQRSQQSADVNLFPYEIWQYYLCTDQSTGISQNNRKFVFVNKQLGDDCHTLVHSDMRGELYNDRWRFELSRRNNNGVGNLDQNAPNGTDFNNVNDIYSNPR